MRSFSSWCVWVSVPYLTLRVLQCHRCKWEHCVVEAEMMYCAALAQRVTRWIWGGWSVLQPLYTAISLPNLISFWMDMTAFQQTTFLRETFLTNICFVLAEDFKCFWLLIKYYSTVHWGETQVDIAESKKRFNKSNQQKGNFMFALQPPQSWHLHWSAGGFTFTKELLLQISHFQNLGIDLVTKHRILWHP